MAELAIRERKRSYFVFLRSIFFDSGDLGRCKKNGDIKATLINKRKSLSLLLSPLYSFPSGCLPAWSVLPLAIRKRGKLAHFHMKASLARKAGCIC